MAKKASRKAKGRTKPGARAGGKRRTAGAKTPKGKARRKRAKNLPKGRKRKALRLRGKAASAGHARAGLPRRSRKTGPGLPRRSRVVAKVGGSGREETLSQTPNTGRSVRGRTNPMPTKRSTGTAAGAGSSRRIPALERDRKRLREIEETLPSPPSSLNMDRHGSAVRSGRAAMQHSKHEHTETSPAMTGGDVDADWEDAYAVGDEAPGGDNPTPDQDRVDDIGKALGIQYQDNEELKPADKVTERDKHRWELDPASSEDYKERD
jgi:uncharacterized protein DUF6335